MQDPGGANEDSGRRSRRLLANGGHAAPAFEATPIDERLTLAESIEVASSAAASSINGASLRKPLNTSHRPSKSSHRKIGRTAMADHAEYCSLMPTHLADRGRDQQGTTDQAHQRDDARHQAGPVEERAEQEGVDARQEGLPDEEGPVVGRDERLSGDDQRARIGPGSRAHLLLQGHDREEADDPKGDDAGFEES